MSETSGRHAAEPAGEPAYVDEPYDEPDADEPHAEQQHVDEPSAEPYAAEPYADEPYADEPYADEPYVDESYDDQAGPDQADDDYLLAQEYAPAGGRRRAKRRGASSCLVFVLIFALVMVGGYYGLTKGIRTIQDQFGEAADYPGPGTGQVAVQVAEGDSIAAIGRELKAQDVVASVDAFITAANANPDSTGIQVGTYTLMTQMKASDALTVLVTPPQTTKVTVPEGLRVVDIVARLSEATGIGANKFNQVLKDPAAIGLPDYAGGNAEGYLFPATYDFPVDATPVSMLTAMVTRWRQAADEAGLEDAAAAVGRTPAELMIIASLVEAEGRGDDMYKISRAIYNRLDNPDNGVTNGLLQIDASVNYGLGQELGVGLTREQLDEDTPYNTNTRTGLPPTPIEAPGDLAIDAAANPADGPWLFWVTVDLETGETKFTDDYDEFLGFDQELCENAPETC